MFDLETGRPLEVLVLGGSQTATLDLPQDVEKPVTCDRSSAVRPAVSQGWQKFGVAGPPPRGAFRASELLLDEVGG